MTRRTSGMASTSVTPEDTDDAFSPATPQKKSRSSSSSRQTSPGAIVRRREKNTVAARNSRARRAAHVQTLEGENTELLADNHALRSQNSTFETQLAALQTENTDLKTQLQALQQDNHDLKANLQGTVEDNALLHDRQVSLHEASTTLAAWLQDSPLPDDRWPPVQETPEDKALSDLIAQFVNDQVELRNP